MAQRLKERSNMVKTGNRASRRHPEKYSTLWTPELYARVMNKNAVRRMGKTK